MTIKEKNLEKKIILVRHTLACNLKRIDNRKKLVDKSRWIEDPDIRFLYFLADKKAVKLLKLEEKLRNMEC